MGFISFIRFIREIHNFIRFITSFWEVSQKDPVLCFISGFNPSKHLFNYSVFETPVSRCFEWMWRDWAEGLALAKFYATHPWSFQFLWWKYLWERLHGDDNDDLLLRRNRIAHLKKLFSGLAFPGWSERIWAQTKLNRMTTHGEFVVGKWSLQADEWICVCKKHYWMKTNKQTNTNLSFTICYCKRKG